MAENITEQRKNPELHQLLAVRKDTANQAAKCRADLENTFEKKTTHFTGRLKTVTLTTEEHGKESGPPKVEDTLDVQTTVRKELKWLRPYLAAHLDVHYQIAKANMVAQADIVIDDGDAEITLRGIPTSTLLELEDYFTNLRGFIGKIPTLDPVQGFTPDPDKGEDVYKSRTVEKVKTAASKKVITLAAPTDKHPAQVQLVDIQEPVGLIHETAWSSMLTPAQKSEMLDRCEKALRAVQTARAIANKATADHRNKIGDTLIGYIFGV